MSIPIRHYFSRLRNVSRLRNAREEHWNLAQSLLEEDVPG
jgi:hypothetical protein